VFRRQIPTRDETLAKNPITLAKFAQHLARSVDAFLRVKPSESLREIAYTDSLTLARLANQTPRLSMSGASVKVASSATTSLSLVLCTPLQGVGCQFCSLTDTFFIPADAKNSANDT
jgi:hypothetical protein